MSDDVLQPGPRHSSRADFQGIRCCLFDVDNTLVGNNSPDLPSKRFVDDAMRLNGHINIGVVTARSLQKVEHIIEAGMNGLSILSNGAQIYDGRSRQMIVELSLAAGTVQSILRTLQHQNIDHWVNDGGQDHFWLGRQGTAPSLGSYARAKNIWEAAEGNNREVVANYEPRKPLVVVAHNVLPGRLADVTALGSAFGGQVTSLVAHEHAQPDGPKTYDVFFLHPDANKRTALEVVAKMLGITAEQIMCVGDGHNDAVLVEATGIGVAMGNAVELVKQVATFIAPSVEHDGAAVALEALLGQR